MNSIFQPFFGLLLAILAGFILVMRLGWKQEKASQKALTEALAEKAELEKKVKNLEDELSKVNSELSLRNQIFEGLKDQYAELEKDYENFSQKAQEKAQKTPLNPTAKEDTVNDSGSPLIKII